MDVVSTNGTNTKPALNYDPIFQDLLDERKNRLSTKKDLIPFFLSHGVARRELHKVTKEKDITFAAKSQEERQSLLCKLFFKALFSLPSAPTPFSPVVKYEEETPHLLPKEIWRHILTTLITEEPDWQHMATIAGTNKQLANIVFDHNFLQRFFGNWPTNYLNIDINIAASVVGKYLQFAPKLSLKFWDDDNSLKQKSIVEITSCQYDSFSFDTFETNNEFVSDENLKRLAMHSPDMHTLRLQGCSQLTPNAIYYLAAYCHELKSLSLDNLRSLSNPALSALAIQTPNLEHLNIKLMEPSSESTDSEQHPLEQGFLHLGRSCKNLQSLRLTNMPITDKALQHLSTESSQTLNHIELINCSNFTNEGLNALLECPHISQFTLLGNSVDIDGTFLVDMADKWPKLRTCEVRNAAKLQPNSLRDFCKKSENLEILIFDQLTLNPDSLSALFSKSKTRTELHFAASCKYDLLGEEIANIIKEKHPSLPNLKMMRFDSDSHIFTYKDLHSIASALPNLVLQMEYLPDEETVSLLKEEFPDFTIDNLA